MFDKFKAKEAGCTREKRKHNQSKTNEMQQSQNQKSFSEHVQKEY